MPCYGPLTGYYSKERNASGKRSIVFRVDQSLSGIPIRLPCGRCVGCRLERSRQWAIRCLHEKKLHNRSSFITLTYANEHLPPGGTLVKEDLQKFMKRLRHVTGPELRFYACGEYGSLNRRPHYHVLLFNYDFDDKRQYAQNKRGDPYYKSGALSKLWGFGDAMLGDVSFDSCAYVARYVVEKITGDKAKAHYEVMDADGVVYTRLPEFTCMSNRPGIGSGYYERYGEEVRAHDSVVINHREVRPPRFYDTRSEAIDSKAFARVKRKRRRMAVLNKSDNTSSRLRVRETLAITLLKRKERKL